MKFQVGFSNKKIARIMQKVQPVKELRLPTATKNLAWYVGSNPTSIFDGVVQWIGQRKCVVCKITLDIRNYIIIMVKSNLIGEEVFDNLFLVRGTIERSYYMSETKDKWDHMQLVVANTLQEAEDKFQQHWESKTIEYSVYYYVNDIETFSTLI